MYLIINTQSADATVSNELPLNDWRKGLVRVFDVAMLIAYASTRPN